MEFSVCFTGKLRAGFNKKAVQSDFSELFTLDDKKILKNIFSAKSLLLIRKNLSLPLAENYRQKLHDIGMEAIILDKDGLPLQKVTSPVNGKNGDSADNHEAPAVVFFDSDDEGDRGHASGTPTIESCSITAPFSWLSESFSLFRKTPIFWAVTTLLWVAISVILQIIPLIGTLVSSIFSGLMYAFLMLAAYRVSHDEEISFSTVMEDIKPHMVPLGLLNLLYGILVFVTQVVAFALTGDSILLGLIIVMALTGPVFMAFWFAPILISVNQVSIPDAMKLSFMACIKNILPLSLYGLLSSILIIIGSIPLLLGLLVVAPVLILSIYQAYNEIVVNQ